MAGSIYELTGEWLNVYNMADDDMDEESWFGMMAAIEQDIEDKAENTAKVIRQLEAEAEGIEAEGKRLVERAKARKNYAKRLKDNLEKSMIATGKTKFKTDLFSFNIQKNPASLKLADEIDFDLVPPQFIKFADPEIDKAKVKEAIKQGETFDWAHLEQTEGLRIK